MTGLMVPFFFTRETVPLPLVGLYRRAAAFLIGGGPSLREVDLSQLEGTWKMTVNNGPTTIRPNANCTVDEPGRFNMSTWMDPTILKFVPMGQFGKPLWDNRLVGLNGKKIQRWEPSKLRVGDCPNVVGYRRNEKFNAARFLYEDTINWGNHGKHGGGRSVLLAALRILFLLGFRRVYLLGIDFEMTPEKRYHFPEERTKASIRGNMRTYAKLQEWFSELQPYFLREKFLVKNCNPHSRLKAFPFMPLEEALAEAMAPLGDYRNERTVGMYQKRDEKIAEIERAQPRTDTTVPLVRESPFPPTDASLQEQVQVPIGTPE